MFDPAHVPPVEQNETVARFILFSGHFRSSDQRVKPDAFIPHPRSEVSMTRHLEASPAELWQEGERVAVLRKVTLYGRADVVVAAFTDEGLDVTANPILANPNHVNASNWPTEKPAQKMIAVRISVKSQYVPKSASPPLTDVAESCGCCQN